MATTTTQKRRRAAVATVAAAAILLAGTFAWTSISQQAKNEAIVDINPGGRLHDDFNGTNKDVYVENFSDAGDGGVDIFARIKLTEYVELGPEAGDKTKTDAERNADAINRDSLMLTNDANPDQKAESNWQVYKPGTGNSLMNTANVSNEYWTLDWGETDDPLPYYMPTFNKNKDSLTADINGTYDGTVKDDIVHYDDYIKYDANSNSEKKDAVYDWDDNQVEETGAAATTTRDQSSPRDSASVLLKEESHSVAQLSTDSQVVTMDYWLNTLKGMPGPYWVYDTDGWAYWAQAIKPGKTTGLFLDGVEMTKVPDENWYYGINVVGQFVTKADLGAFSDLEGDAPSENALKLLELAAAEGTVVNDAAALREALAKGEDVVLSGPITTSERETKDGLGFSYNLLMTEGTLSGESMTLNGAGLAGLFLNSEDGWPETGESAKSVTVKDTAITTTDATAAVYSQAINGPITLNNVEIKSANTGVYAAMGNGTTTLNDVTVEATGEDTVDGKDYFNSAVAVAGGANVVINGGSYTGDNAVYIFSSGGDVTINDGFFDGDLTVDAPEISSLVIQGGTFTVDPSAYVDTEYYEVVQEEKLYTVVPLDNEVESFRIYCSNHSADSEKPWYNGEAYIFSGAATSGEEVEWSLTGGTAGSYGQKEEWSTNSYTVVVDYDEPAGTTFTVTAKAGDETDSITFTIEKLEALSLVYNGDTTTKYSDGAILDLTKETAPFWFYTYETANVYYGIEGSSLEEGTYFDTLGNKVVLGDGEVGTDGMLTLTVTHWDDPSLTATYQLKIK